MQKITFENLPSTNTPLNASNLNTLQSNVESAFNNTYGTSQTEGYCQEYINKFTNKNIMSASQTNETSYTTNVNYRAHVVPVGTIISQVGDGLELTNDGGIKIKGDYKYVKVSAAIGLGSSNPVNSYGINLGKEVNADGNVTGNFFSIVDQYNHANTFKLMSTNELLVSVNQNDAIYLGVYVFTKGTVQVRSGYLTVEVVE